MSKKEERKNKITDTLGIRRLEELEEDEKNLPVISEEEESTDIVESDNLPANINQDTANLISDIDLAKNNVKNIIQQGDSALSNIMDLAEQSESPRAYEVASTLMKTLLDANKDFVDMSNKKLGVKRESDPNNKTQQNVTNNNLVVTTADLLKMLNGDGSKE